MVVKGAVGVLLTVKSQHVLATNPPRRVRKGYPSTMHTYHRINLPYGTRHESLATL